MPVLDSHEVTLWLMTQAFCGTVDSDRGTG